MTKDYDKSDSISILYNHCQEKIVKLAGFRYGMTWQLVGEACGCYRARCYIAAQIMCRAALESTLYETFAWKKEEKRLSLEPRLKYYRIGLQQLIKWSKDTSLLNGEQEKIAYKIQKEGNFGAHIKQKIDQELSRYIIEGKAPEEPYKIWADEINSLTLLKETIELVISLIRKAVEIEKERA